MPILIFLVLDFNNLLFTQIRPNSSVESADDVNMMVYGNATEIASCR